MTSTHKTRLTLGRAVKTARTHLGYAQNALPDGPSGTKVRDIEKAQGDIPSGLTLGALDRSLQWEPGTARRLLEGEITAPGQVVTDLGTGVIAALHTIPESERRQRVRDLLAQLDALGYLNDEPPVEDDDVRE